MAQALIAVGKFRAEVTQESVHRNTVRKGNTQLIRIFFKPGGERGTLAGGEIGADLLVRLEPFVGLGAHRRQVAATR
ncbi:hypothetical protein D3C76_929590 [compost metagenome]